MNKSTLASIIIILIAFILGFYFYAQMPEHMATHWNIRGEADGYMSKILGLFFIPCLMLPILAIFLIVPKIDPLKENIKQFRKYYDMMILAVFGFMIYLYILTLIWNLGFQFDIGVLLIPGFVKLFYVIGTMLEKAKRNWFIGIRTPWTLSSEKVWNKTHKLGGKLFKIAAAITLIGILFGEYAILFVIIPIFAVSIYLTVYSYLIFQKEKK